MIRALQWLGTIVMGVVVALALAYVVADMYFILSALIWVHR